MIHMKRIWAALPALLLCLGAAGQNPQLKVESWTITPMDGSRAGTKSPSADNVLECLGEVKDGIYYAPNGRVYGKNTATARVAKEIIDAQPAMASVKKVVGWSTRVMKAKKPQSDLSNWFIDNIMESAAELSGKDVSFGVGNFGGIRCDMPEGDVTLDDLMSMFPFRNQVVYLELQGRDIRNILESMAADRFQVLGGCEIVVRDHKLVSAKLDGENIDDGRWYGVATISFLLNGGDGLYMSHNSRNMQIFDKDIIDIILEKVKKLTDAGKPIEYHTDRRIIVEN